jgi:hypothetical protein
MAEPCAGTPLWASQAFRAAVGLDGEVPHEDVAGPFVLSHRAFCVLNEQGAGAFDVWRQQMTMEMREQARRGLASPARARAIAPMPQSRRSSSCSTCCA